MVRSEFRTSALEQRAQRTANGTVAQEGDAHVAH